MLYRLIHLFIGALLLSCVQFGVFSGNETPALVLTSVIIYWWVAQPIPIYVTALLPLLFGPFWGLIDFVGLAQAYGNKMVFLFFGGFLIALGIEKTNLHKHFAQYIIAMVGKNAPTLLLSFMIATAFLSMWISNTATALMMLPMALSVIDSIPRFRLKKRFSIALLLGVAFSANIGGTATLIGTPPNVLMAGILSEQFTIKITFLDWLKIGLPFMVLLFTICYFTLRIVFLRGIDLVIPRQKPKKMDNIQKKMLVVFGLTVLFWMFSSVFNSFFEFKLNDTMIALFGGLLLFIVPSKGKKTLLNWEDTRKLPWGILFLFGGGLAMAKILSNTDFINEIINLMASSSSLSFFGFLLVVFTLTLFLTELMSNLALVSLLLPVIGSLCLSLSMPLEQVAAGIALCSSCAFMLPVATPPNAIVFSANKFTVLTMVKIGVVLNLFAIAIALLVVYLFF